MKFLFATVAVLLLLNIAITTAQTRIECPSEVSAKCAEINTGYVKHFPYPQDCSRYCTCDWGKAYEQHCGEGTIFDQETEVCDHPQRAKCTQ